MLSHRIVRLIVAFAVGLAVSVYAFLRVTDPEPAMQRAREEAVVLHAREILRAYTDAGEDFEIVDPLAPDREIGKVYIYPTASGWEVSGHYRRHDTDRWHPFLMKLNADNSLADLSVRDSSEDLASKALNDPRFTTRP